MDSYEFQLESRNLINEILNTATRDKSDVQYIKVNGSTGKKFGLLIISGLNRRRLLPVSETQEKTKLMRQESFRRYSAKWNLLSWKGYNLVHQKRNMELLEKIIVYPNQAIHDDCVVAFTGGYEKTASEKQSRRVDVDKGYST